MAGLRPRALAATATALLCGAAPASALSIYGGARPLYGAGGCVRDAARQAPSERRCPGTVSGLAGAGALAISPDGRSVYVAAPDDSALVALSRNAHTGGLHPLASPSGRDCVQAPHAGACTVDDPALAGVDAVAVSPDGRFVYAGARDSAAVSAYTRARNGMLRPLGRSLGGSGPGAQFGCVDGQRLSGTDARCAVHAAALAAVSALAVSPDGRDLYTVSYGLDPGQDSIVALARDPNTGGMSPLRGRGGCWQSRPAAQCSSVPGLDGAQAVLISPDGRFVYVASDISGSVVAFQRNRFTGRLFPIRGPGGCVGNASPRPEPAPDDAPCPVTVPQMGGARSLALSPNGRELYVAAFDPGAVIALQRDPHTGRLAPLPAPPLCLQAYPDPSCPVGIAQLHGASAVALSPSGAIVWVACEGGDSLVALRRDALSGRLAPLSAVPTAGAALGAPDSLAITRDGRYLYLASQFDDAVAGLGVHA